MLFQVTRHRLVDAFFVTTKRPLQCSYYSNHGSNQPSYGLDSRFDAQSFYAPKT
jgi:hypothetical protein